MNLFDTFQLWSHKSSKNAEAISSNLPWRSYNELSPDEKRMLLLHFKKLDYFWGYRTAQRSSFTRTHSEISGTEKGLTYAINSMNSLYKKECYGKRTLEKWSPDNVYEDFKGILINSDQNVVYELLSLYALSLIEEGQKKMIFQSEGESKEDFEKRLADFQFKEFDKFAKTVNSIFENYKINIYLTRSGFAPRQEEMIIENVYKPVLEVLTDGRWRKVNREISDAFNAFVKSTPDGYSECMTHCYSAAQAFLQELVGQPDASIKDANLEARNKNLIPDDAFSVSVFKEILSVFEQLRKAHGDAHPKREYADEKTANLMLNLTMVYLQHCINK